MIYTAKSLNDLAAYLERLGDNETPLRPTKRDKEISQQRASVWKAAARIVRETKLELEVKQNEL